MFLADEFTPNYHALTQKVLGPGPRHPRSFIAHFMLMQRDLLQAMEARALAQCGMGLVAATLAHLDRNSSSSMSEYEMYGNFLNRHHRDRFVTRYWYNVNVEPHTTASLDELRARHGRMNSVSAHVH